MYLAWWYNGSKPGEVWWVLFWHVTPLEESTSDDLGEPADDYRMISSWGCTVLKGMIRSIACLFEGEPVAAQAEIADMGEMRGSGLVRCNHAAGK